VSDVTDRTDAGSQANAEAGTDSNSATIRTELRRLFAEEATVVVDARARATEARPPSPEEASLLAWLATRPPDDGPIDVVEVGADGGVGALRIVAALPAHGTLTVIEADTNAHALTSEAAEVGGQADRVRAILGEPSDVLPRLADGRYGMCVLQCSPARYLGLLPEVLRLLAPGGILVARGVLRRGEHGAALARFLESVASMDTLRSVVLEEHDGLLLATHVPAAG